MAAKDSVSSEPITFTAQEIEQARIGNYDPMEARMQKGEATRLRALHDMENPPSLSEVMRLMKAVAKK